VAAKEEESGVTPKGYAIYWNGGQTGTIMVKDEERSTILLKVRSLSVYLVLYFDCPCIKTRFT
jgi:hypothetical protein